ncbi:MAG: type VI secretion system tip protein VgrG [Planctomycetaceae bacterium]|nr:type VI secretion system tip protein VgrG [Planctomycetaceae bacterium]MCB9950067.1 type VI secretion system tip protein VgrG [Planctomycetaceae bacterium]
MPVVTPTILSEGKAISAEIALVSLDVSREVNRIPRARLQFLDGSAAHQDFHVSGLPDFEPGKHLEIRMRYEGAADSTLFKGIVTGVRVEADTSGTALFVELKDASVKLTATRHSSVFAAMTETDVFKQLISKAKLAAGKIAKSQTKHPQLIQYNCTDWDFMVTRAELLGCVVLVDDGVVNIEPLKVSRPTLKIEWGLSEVFDFVIEASGSHQVTKVQAVSWDVKSQKMAKPATAADISAPGGNLNAAKIAKSLGVEATQLIHGAPLHADEQKSWANSRMAQSRWSMLRGRVALPGTAAVKPLDTIEISGVGTRFDDQTVVTGIRHRLDSHGWQTDIQFGATPERFCEQPNIQQIPASGLIPAVTGLQIGIVDKFEDDPENELRIKVILPVLGEKSGSVWARLAMPDAGKNRGFLFRPEVGDEVVVGFFNNDPRVPVVLGSLASSKNTPGGDYAKPTEKNENKGIVTKMGTRIGFVDAEKASVFIETKNKNKVVLDDAAESIELTDQHGNVVRMDKSGIEIKSVKDLKFTASGNVKVKGSKIDIN